MTTNTEEDVRSESDKSDDSVEVEVKWATSAGDFIPFTPLPKRYHGKRVKIVIAEE